MPFTFSHPAIVLPLTKFSSRYVSASALIIGSMSPDFEYFIRMKLMQVHGHTLAGAFYFDLPITILTVIIFQLLVKDVLIDHLPNFLQQKYKKHRNDNWLIYFRERWYVVLMSAIVGIFSHLFWDGYTHANGYFVQFIPWLQSDLLIFNVKIPAYDLMQLVSTLVGGVAILIFVLWPSNNLIKDQNWNKVFVYLAVVMTINFIVIVLHGFQNLGDFIAVSISGGLIGIIGASFVLSVLNKIKMIKT